jgi:hypothetical protein
LKYREKSNTVASALTAKNTPTKPKKNALNIQNRLSYNNI